MKHLFAYLKTRLMFKHFFTPRNGVVHSDTAFEKEIKDRIENIKSETHNLLRSFRIAIPEKKDIDAMLLLIESKFESLRNSIRIRYQSEFRKTLVHENANHQKQLGNQMLNELSELQKQNNFLTRDIDETRLNYNWKYYPLWIVLLGLMYLGEAYFTFEAIVKVLRDSIIAAFVIASAIAAAIGITNHFIGKKVDFKTHPKKKFFAIALAYFIVFYFLGILRAKSIGVENAYFAFETLGFVCVSSLLAFGAAIVSVLFLPNQAERIQKQQLDELKTHKQELDTKIDEINVQIKAEPHRQNREMIDQAKHIVFEKTLIDLVNSECEVLKSEFLVNIRIYTNMHNTESNHLLK